MEKGKHVRSIRFTDEEIAWLEAQAKKEMRTVGGLVRYAVSNYRTSIDRSQHRNTNGSHPNTASGQ